MKKYNIKAETIMYVHVGAGEENCVDPLEYVIKEDKSGKPWFYRINLNSLLKKDANWAKEFIKAIENEKTIGKLRTILRERFNPDEKDTWIHKAAVSKSVWETYKSKIGILNPSNQLFIRCMPFINGRVYIPGSSIKGALRTAFLDRKAYFYKSDDGQNGYEALNRDIIEEIKRERKQEDKATLIEKKLLNYKRIEEDPFKAIKVEDAFLPPDSTEIVEVKNVREEDKKVLSLDIFVEAVKPKVNFEITIGYEDKVAVDKNNLGKIALTIEKLLNASKEYFLDAIANEQENHYPQDSLADQKVQDVLMFVYDENNEIIPNKYIIRVGRFSHLESITYNHRGKGKLCEPKHKKGWGKSRNLVDGKYPLGAVSYTHLR
ncbi:MAG: type III-A CRISPR-associated RAMP protein Csm5, partial [Chitinispirillaceae bacterium]|nr:type III-A CRISPR-associated RAMP protein Csm5 [Chitinispirillaceae bacterium]